jgi:phage terminase large subunit-like protein
MPNERLFAAIWCADDTVEWHTIEALRMANPNLGVSNDAEKIRLAQEEAVTKPEKQNIVKAMHLNLWSTAAAAWMNMQSWRKCCDSALTNETVKGLPGWLGADLASRLDLAAVLRLHRQEIDGKPHYYAFCRAYLPAARVNLAENQHFQKWATEGYLTVTPGSSLDYAVVTRDALADIGEFRILEIPYDTRYADQWTQEVSEKSGIPRVLIEQFGMKLTLAMKELEAAVADGRFHHDGNPVMSWCVSNIVTHETGMGNYAMPGKEKKENKIDAGIALLIAMTRAMVGAPVPEPTDASSYFMVI